MSTPADLRERLSTSDFFKEICNSSNPGPDDLFQIIVASSGSLYGINQNSDNILSVGLNGRHNTATVCSAPVHCIDHITESNGGSLAVWSSVGVSILKNPIKPGSSPLLVNLRLGGHYIRSVRWLEESLHVLNSNNEIYSFEKNEYTAAPLISSFTAVADDICDFTPLKFSSLVSEFLTISTNGFLRINHDILTNVEIEGDLVVGQIDTDCFAVANCKVSHFHIIFELDFKTYN